MKRTSEDRADANDAGTDPDLVGVELVRGGQAPGVRISHRGCSGRTMGRKPPNELGGGPLHLQQVRVSPVRIWAGVGCFRAQDAGSGAKKDAVARRHGSWQIWYGGGETRRGEASQRKK